MFILMCELEFHSVLSRRNSLHLHTWCVALVYGVDSQIYDWF